MEADCFFRMGSTHSVCQDYAAISPGGMRVAVSDGCSSAPHTDFGARFLVRAALSADHVDEFKDEEALIGEADQMRLATGLPEASLQATLLMARICGDAVHVQRAGDGVVVGRKRDGTVWYEHVSYHANAPAYLSYLLRNETIEEFCRVDQGSTFTYRERSPEGRWRGLSLGCVSHSYLGISRHRYPLEEMDLILLFTDGIDSFTGSDGNVVPIETLLDEILSFKNFKGQFLSRRCSRFLAKTCVEKGWKHADDFSVAGIYFGDGA